MIFLSSFENHLKRIHNRNFTATLIEEKGGGWGGKKIQQSLDRLMEPLSSLYYIYIYILVLYPIHFINYDPANVIMTYFITEQQLQLDPWTL